MRWACVAASGARVPGQEHICITGRDKIKDSAPHHSGGKPSDVMTFSKLESSIVDTKSKQQLEL